MAQDIANGSTSFHVVGRSQSKDVSNGDIWLLTNTLLPTCTRSEHSADRISPNGRR